MNKRAWLAIWWIAAGILACPCLSQDAEESSNAPYVAVMDAVLQSLKPAENMRVQLTRDIPKPVTVGKSDMARKYPQGLPPLSIDYSITLSGMRSRIETCQRMSQMAQNGSPYPILRNIEVFDGKETRTLTTPSDGPPRGGRMLQGPSSLAALGVLYDSFAHLIDGPARDTHTYRLLAGAEENTHVLVLEVAGEYGRTIRLRIDTSKNYSVTKVERFRSDGTAESVVNYEHKQMGDGIWYPSRVEKTRYQAITGKAFGKETLSVANAEFNVDIAEEAFHLNFPPGTRVLDMVLDSSYFVGAPPQPIVERELLAAPNAQPKSGPVPVPGTKGVRGETTVGGASQSGARSAGSPFGSPAQVRGTRSRLFLPLLVLVGLGAGGTVVFVCYLCRRVEETPR